MKWICFIGFPNIIILIIIFTTLVLNLNQRAENELTDYFYNIFIFKEKLKISYKLFNVLVKTTLEFFDSAFTFTGGCSSKCLIATHCDRENGKIDYL